jgi:hypothetical protein
MPTAHLKPRQRCQEAEIAAQAACAIPLQRLGELDFATTQFDQSLPRKDSGAHREPFFWELGRGRTDKR